MNRILRIGKNSLNINIADASVPIREFIWKITQPGSECVPATHTLDLRSGSQVTLTVDVRHKRCTLVIPDPAACRDREVIVQIAILQAATRGLSAMGTVDDTWLLHGSAVTSPGGRSAVAILDGGRGQGKTSLALALAQAGAKFLVDEFTFVDIQKNRPKIIGLPKLPWHIRPDVASVLGMKNGGPMLAYPHDLEKISIGESNSIPLRYILTPDTTTDAGVTYPISSDNSRCYLTAAALDHMEKLFNPALDHVSIFSSHRDIQITHYSDPNEERVLNALCQLKTFGVGIGSPQDLPKSAAAIAQLGLS